MYKRLITLSAVVMLSGCGVGSSTGVVSREDNSGGIFGMSKLDDVVVDGANALEGVDNVVIGSFKVGFVESAKQTNQAKGTFMKSAMGGKARGNVTLEGITDETKQSIANAAYEDFISKLQAQGYSLADRSTLTSSSEYSSMTTKQFPFLADTSGILSEYGKTVFFQPAALGKTGIAFSGDFPESSSGLSAASLVPGITGISGALNANADMKVANFAEKQKIGVLSVTYIVDFAAAGGHEGISSASVNIGQNLAVTQGSMKLMSGTSSTFKNGMANIYLGQPIQSGMEFGEIVDDTTGDEVALQEAANAASLLLGQGTNRSRDYIIKADPAKYAAQSLDVLTKANSALLSKAE